MSENTDNKTYSHNDDNKLVKKTTKIDTGEVDNFMKNMERYTGRNRDILIRLGLVKPTENEIELYKRPNWFHKSDSHKKNDDTKIVSSYNHKKKTIEI